MGNPSSKECVWKDPNNGILISPSTNMVDRGELGVESCLVRIRNGGNNICHRPKISYCEATKQVLIQDDLKHKLVIVL